MEPLGGSMQPLGTGSGGLAVQDVADETLAPNAVKTVSKSPTKIAIQRIRKDRVAMVSLCVVLFFVLVAIFAPLLASLEGQSYTDSAPGLDGPVRFPDDRPHAPALVRRRAAAGPRSVRPMGLRRASVAGRGDLGHGDLHHHRRHRRSGLRIPRRLGRPGAVVGDGLRSEPPVLHLRRSRFRRSSSSRSTRAATMSIRARLPRSASSR